MTTVPSDPDARPGPPLPYREPRGFKLFLRELAARFSMLSPGSPWRDPALYGHPLVGDDYWILSGRWRTHSDGVHPARIHPRLGWVQGHILPLNPSGLHDATNQKLQRNGRPKVLFLGDSYVAGVAPEEEWLPTLLEAELGGAADVVHLGVGGYGTDQMHLLLEELLANVDDPAVVLMGVMDFSLDRATQRVRSYQKPVLEKSAEGELVARNVPIDPRPRRFFRRARTSFRSFVKQAWVRRRDGGDPFRAGLDEVFRVNRPIIDANIQLARGHGAALAYVLFHDWYQLDQPDPRGTFLRTELERRGVPFLETRDPLQDHIRSAGTNGAELYSKGHHNSAGNRALVAPLAALVRPLLERRPHPCTTASPAPPQ